MSRKPDGFILLCGICERPQKSTFSGTACENGHGGAQAKNAPAFVQTPEDRKTLEAAAEFLAVCGSCTCDDCREGNELAAKLRAMIGSDE